MLKFKSQSFQWSEIQSVQISNEDTNEVSVVTANGSYAVGEYPLASNAASIKNLIENGKEASEIGGVMIDVIIDDL